MSNEVMKSEYPDGAQRTAVCFSQWKRRKKKKSNAALIEELCHIDIPK